MEPNANDKIRLKRNVYLIIIGILLLSIIVQLARSEFINQFSRNDFVAQDRQMLAPLSSSESHVSAELTQAAAAADQLTCVYYTSTDQYSINVKNNAEHVLTYMKKGFRSMDTANAPLDVDGCQTLIVTNQHLDQVENVDAIIPFVEDGGYVMFASQLDQDEAFYRLYRKLGIVSAGIASVQGGVHLLSNVLIGEKGYSTNGDYALNMTNPVELDRETTILAENSEKIPLIWKRPYGQGMFLVFNGTILQEKINRGLLTGCISLLEPDYIYPIFNLKTVYLDDFPAPIGEGEPEQQALIYRDYKKDIRRFYRDIWWPDMLKAAKKYDVKYTAALIQSYHDLVVPPFQYPIDEDRTNTIAYGREILKSGGEIGIHGYNHQSLQMSDAVANDLNYKVWTSIDYMEQSVREVVRYINEIFPSYQTAIYVPPSNVLSSGGREALKRGWSDLSVIASLYPEDATEKSYVQEFEIAQDGIVEMPRVTSGYFETSFERWAEANAISSIGVFSHFVHPDDVIDLERGKGTSWKEMNKQFTQKLSRVKETYPWLRATTASEAASHLVNSLQAKVMITKSEDRIEGTIANVEDELYFVLRTERGIKRKVNCEVEEIDDQVYLVTTKANKFEIGLGG